MGRSQRVVEFVDEDETGEGPGATAVGPSVASAVRGPAVRRGGRRRWRVPVVAGAGLLVVATTWSGAVEEAPVEPVGWVDDLARAPVEAGSWATPARSLVSMGSLVVVPTGEELVGVDTETGVARWRVAAPGARCGPTSLEEEWVVQSTGAVTCVSESAGRVWRVAADGAVVAEFDLPGEAWAVAGDGVATAAWTDAGVEVALVDGSGARVWSELVRPDGEGGVCVHETASGAMDERTLTLWADEASVWVSGCGVMGTFSVSGEQGTDAGPSAGAMQVWVQDADGTMRVSGEFMVVTSGEASGDAVLDPACGDGSVAGTLERRGDDLVLVDGDRVVWRASGLAPVQVWARLADVIVVETGGGVAGVAASTGTVAWRWPGGGPGDADTAESSVQFVDALTDGSTVALAVQSTTGSGPLAAGKPSFLVGIDVATGEMTWTKGFPAVSRFTAVGGRLVGLTDAGTAAGRVVFFG